MKSHRLFISFVILCMVFGLVLGLAVADDNGSSSGQGPGDSGVAPMQVTTGMHVSDDSNVSRNSTERMGGGEQPHIGEQPQSPENPEGNESSQLGEGAGLRGLSGSDELSGGCGSDVKDQIEKLQSQVLQAVMNGNSTASLQSQIQLLRQQIANCSNNGGEQEGLGIAIGQNCMQSQPQLQEMNSLRERYAAAISSNNLDDAKQAREQMTQLQEYNAEQQRECMQQIVPGLAIRQNISCTIPQDIYNELDSLQTNASGYVSNNQSIPDSIVEQISSIQNRIARMNALCNANALNVSNVSQVRLGVYYRARMTDALNSGNIDSQIAALRSVRTEIDSTLQKLISEKKGLNYDDFKGLAGSIFVNPDDIEIGGSNISAGNVTINASLGDSNVSITAGNGSVVISYDGLDVETDSLTIGSSGVMSGNATLNITPLQVLAMHRNIQRGDIKGIRLENNGNAPSYNVEYNARRKLLGMIPVTATQSVQVNAQNGVQTGSNSPWWSFLSTEDSAQVNSSENASG